MVKVGGSDQFTVGGVLEAVGALVWIGLMVLV